MLCKCIHESSSLCICVVCKCTLKRASGFSFICESGFSFILVSKWKRLTLFEYSYLSTDFKVWITFKFFSLITVTYFKVIGFNCVYILLLTAISQFLVHLNNTSLGIWSLLSGHCFSFLMWFILNRSLQDIVSFCRLPKLPKFRYFL